jgi:hypothetical protein
MDRTAFLPAEEAFGYWFSGFVDGEGCFSIARTPWGFRCEFIIKLRADDLPMLEAIRAELAIGRINAGAHSTAGINGKPWVRYVVAKKTELIRLTEILDAYPLRSKKRRDYAIWREAAIHWANSQQPVDWSPVTEAFHALRDVREYAEAVVS